LILDNIPFHKATQSLTSHGLPTIKQTADSFGIRLHYTAPYCPFLNPSEYIFRLIKGHVRREIPKTEDELRDAIVNAIDRITPNKTSRKFDHCFHRGTAANLTTR
ncbi:hypothetical protein M427DRAFT_100718, partial [Gonapodya prolifera JEL478]